MSARLVAVAGLAGLLIAAPAQAQNSDLIGALLGGAGGAVAGAQFGKGNGRLATTAAGTLVGALIGQSVGRSLGRADYAYAAQRGYAPPAYYGYDVPRYRPSYAPTYYAPPPPPRVVYAEPRYHYDEPRYAARPVVYDPPPAYGAQPHCREYTAPVTVGGRTVEGYGQACLQPDGSWRLGALQPVR
jgi:surface antigen